MNDTLDEARAEEAIERDEENRFIMEEEAESCRDGCVDCRQPYKPCGCKCHQNLDKAMKDLHQSGKRLEKAVDSLEKKVKPDYFKDTVELFGRINQAIYGINPYKRL